MPYTGYDRKSNRRGFNDLEDLLHHGFDRIEAKLDALLEGGTSAETKAKLEETLNQLVEMGEETMATVQELNESVADLTASVDAAVAAIGNTSGIDPAELDAAVASIKEQAKKLNDAVHAASM